MNTKAPINLDESAKVLRGAIAKASESADPIAPAILGQLALDLAVLALLNEGTERGDKLALEVLKARVWRR